MGPSELLSERQGHIPSPESSAILQLVRVNGCRRGLTRTVGPVLGGEPDLWPCAGRGNPTVALCWDRRGPGPTHGAAPVQMVEE